MSGGYFLCLKSRPEKSLKASNPIVVVTTLNNEKENGNE